MEFPEDVLKLIREYSRPLTRVDWKGCKWKESLCIYEINMETLSRLKTLFPAVLYRSISSWSLYGRIRILKHTLDEPSDSDDTWYETQFQLYWP